MCFSGTKLFEYYNFIYKHVYYHVLWTVLMGQNFYYNNFPLQKILEEWYHQNQSSNLTIIII